MLPAVRCLIESGNGSFCLAAELIVNGRQQAPLFVSVVLRRKLYLRSLVSDIVAAKLFVWRGLGKTARRVEVVQRSIDQQLAHCGQLLDR